MNVFRLKSRYLIWFGCIVLSACSKPKMYEFNVDSGDSGIALRQFAIQANLEIVFNSSDLEGIDTNAIYGRMTPDDALSKMLKNTRLDYRVENNSNVYAILVR